MIIAEQKAMDEILRSIEPYHQIVVAGCGTCVSVSMAGGEKETLKMAGLIRLAAQRDGKQVQVTLSNPIRQCDMEFLDGCEAELEDADCILSLACGAGVQFMAEKFPDKVVVPGVNTKFIGVNRALGYWTEMCQGCGNCLLEKTGGVCPVARCAKSNFNGPCGGSAGGVCEIDDHIDCGWQLIYERLERLGQTQRLLEISDIRDWSSSRDGGPRSMRRDDMIV